MTKLNYVAYMHSKALNDDEANRCTEVINELNKGLLTLTMGIPIKLPSKIRVAQLAFNTIDRLTDDQAYTLFRFTKDQLHVLCDLLGFREKTFSEDDSNGYTCDGERAMLLMLYKLANAGITNYDLDQRFGFTDVKVMGGRSDSWASSIFKAALFFVFDNFEDLLQGELGNHDLENPQELTKGQLDRWFEWLPICKAAIEEQIKKKDPDFEIQPYDSNIWMFMDGTLINKLRPSGPNAVQQMCFK